MWRGQKPEREGGTGVPVNHAVADWPGGGGRSLNAEFACTLLKVTREDYVAHLLPLQVRRPLAEPTRMRLGRKRAAGRCGRAPLPSRPAPHGHTIANKATAGSPLSAYARIRTGSADSLDGCERKRVFLRAPGEREGVVVCGGVITGGRRVLRRSPTDGAQAPQSCPRARASGGAPVFWSARFRARRAREFSPALQDADTGRLIDLFSEVLRRPDREGSAASAAPRRPARAGLLDPENCTARHSARPRGAAESFVFAARSAAGAADAADSAG